MGRLLNRAGTLVREDTKKADILNASFVFVFTEKTSPQVSLAQELREKECWKEDSPLGRENSFRDHQAGRRCQYPRGLCNPSEGQV